MYMCIYIYIYIFIIIIIIIIIAIVVVIMSLVCIVCPALRPVRLLRVWVSEGLTQANS